MIVPIRHKNWEDMMEEVIKTSLRVKNESRASWNFRNVYFMDEMLDLHEPEHFPSIPPYLHMMQHVYRSANYRVSHKKRYLKSEFFYKHSMSRTQ